MENSSVSSPYFGTQAEEFNEEFKISLEEVTDPYAGLKIIKKGFVDMFPHLSTTTVFEECLKQYISGFVSEVLHAKAEQNNFSAELLDNLLLTLEVCENVLKYLNSNSTNYSTKYEDTIGIITTMIGNVLISSLDYLKQKVKFDENPEVEHLLGAVLKHSSELTFFFCEFLSTLNNSNFDDVEILSDSCRIMAKLARDLSCLSDIKCSVVAWRTFAAIIQKHKNVLGPVCDFKIPLNFLFEEILEGLNAILNSKDKNNSLLPGNEKVICRIVKMVSFCLKIFMSVCEKFKDYMKNCYKTVILLLIVLYRFFPFGLSLMFLNEEMKKLLHGQLMVAIEPLLYSMTTEVEFQKIFCELCENDSEVPVEIDLEICKEFIENPSIKCELLLIALNICPNLVKERETGALKDLWLCDLLKIIFKLFPYCHVELSYPLLLPGVMHGGHAQNMISLFEHTFIHTCSLICIADCDLFSKIESILFQFLLDFDHWRSLLVSDIFCFLARYGNEELCSSHYHIFIDMLIETKDPKLKIIFENLCLRFTEYLSGQEKEKNLSQFIAENKIQCLPPSIKYALRDSIQWTENKLGDDYVNRVSGLVDFLLQFKSDKLNEMDVLNYFRTEYWTNEFASSLPTKKMCGNLIILLQRIHLSSECPPLEKLFSLTVNALAGLTEFLSSVNISNILEKLLDSFCHLKKALMLPVCRFINSLKLKNFSHESHCHEILENISVLLAQLLSSESSFVHQCGICCLVSFGQCTKHEEVLSKCLMLCSDTVKERVTNYLKLCPFEAPIGTNASELLKTQLKSSTEKEDFDVAILQKEINLDDKSWTKKRKIEETLPDAKRETEFYSLINNLNVAKSIIMEHAFSWSDERKDIIFNLHSEIGEILKGK